MHEPKGNLYNIFRLLVLAFQIQPKIRSAITSAWLCGRVVGLDHSANSYCFTLHSHSFYLYLSSKLYIEIILRLTYARCWPSDNLYRPEWSCERRFVNCIYALHVKIITLYMNYLSLIEWFFVLFCFEFRIQNFVCRIVWANRFLKALKSMRLVWPQ